MAKLLCLVLLSTCFWSQITTISQPPPTLLTESSRSSLHCASFSNFYFSGPTLRPCCLTFYPPLLRPRQNHGTNYRRSLNPHHLRTTNLLQTYLQTTPLPMRWPLRKYLNTPPSLPSTLYYASPLPHVRAQARSAYLALPPSA